MLLKKTLLYSTLTILALSIAGTAFLLSLKQKVFDYTPAALAESALPLENPYIGWYQIFRYTLSGTGEPGLEPMEDQEYGPGLVMLQFNLQNYAQTPIDDAGLQQLDDVLAAWHATGKQLIIRFLYDWDANALEQEPENLSLVLEHMSQTAEIINRYSDCVYILQGIFVGSWGEMHSSNYMGQNDMLTLINHLAAVTSPDIFLSVRTPDQWRTIADSSAPLPSEQAFDGSLAARLGLFNDGMLGSETDLGSYGEPDVSFSLSDFGKRPRQEELLFQADLCCYVPNGGEVVIDNPYNDLSSAIQDLAYTHVSYLNSAYDDAVLSKWRESTWQENDIFYGMNGYDYISRHLGYRYVLRSPDLLLSSPQAEKAVFSVILENVGFSGSYKAFDVSLILKDTESGQEYIFPIAVDTRLLQAGSLIALKIPLEFSAYTPGTYNFFLSITDPLSNFPVHLANEGVESENSCFMGSLTIQELSQWELILDTLIGET